MRDPAGLRVYNFGENELVNFRQTAPRLVINSRVSWIISLVFVVSPAVILNERNDTAVLYTNRRTFALYYLRFYIRTYVHMSLSIEKLPPEDESQTGNQDLESYTFA